ncbi:SDR family oxidoreductase [bacterium]|nr:MAG: SDR family oxidoreductase [bacterium]
MRFTEKVAIVTGAASGIGLATARLFAQEGAKVVVADLNEEKAKAAADELGGLGVRCDVSKEDDVRACVDKALEAFGRWDILVNNAGLMVFKPLEEHTIEDWTRVLSVDLLGAFLFTREAFLRMKGGAIVNVSSVHAVETTPQVASYAAAKTALVALTRSSSIEGKKKGIRTNVILPGAVDTPMLWENPNVKAGIETIDMTDVGKPEEVAAAIAYLASDEASFVYGTAMRVDGGRLDRL